MDAFLVSTSIVALAEIGDKTQLLAFVLAAQFRRPWPIIWGILVATVANHAFAAALGAWLTSLLSPESLRWILGLSFLAMAAWILIPDKLDDDRPTAVRLGVFATTLLAFFRMQLAMLEARLISEENGSLVEMLQPIREARLTWARQQSSGIPVNGMPTGTNGSIDPNDTLRGIPQPAAE